MSTVIHRKVEALRAGEDPHVVARMKSGWLIAGEVQFLPGYCLLLADPVVSHVNELQGHARDQFFHDMGHAGDILLEVTEAVRINYEILGNLEPALHAHLFPRYDVEPSELRTRPAWDYDWATARKFNLELDYPWVTELRERLASHPV